jgi:glycosyltransferase involved in cell wall biosynthesis
MNIPSRRIKLRFFLRKPLKGSHFSIERLFAAVIDCLPVDRYEIQVLNCPIVGRGVFRRFALMIWASFHQGDVNHITGDINYLGLLMRPSRTLLTITDSASMMRLVSFKRWFYRAFWLRLPIWHAEHVVAISNATLLETLSYVSSDSSKFSVIPCCTPFEVLAEPRPFSEGPPRILIVGTNPNKNLDRIFKALKGVLCQLIIIGPLSESQRELIALNSLEVESLLDIHDDEIVREYLNADMLVFVSTYEGFGLPILEGQAAGRPVITSCLSPMKEVAGGGACLVDPYSIVDIREGVLRVIHDSQYRAMLIQAGFDNVRAYSPKNVARQYSSLYEALFSGAAPSHVQNQEHLLDKSAKTADRAPTLHVFGQHQPTLNNHSPQSSTPNYYSDVIYFKAASLFGLAVKHHRAEHTKNIFKLIWLSIIGMKVIYENPDQPVIVWQGYGTYAILVSAIFLKKRSFILNTYKVPGESRQALKKRINDKLLKKAISLATGVVTISPVQAKALKRFNPNTAWIPFASDANWWKPGFPDLVLLANHGINHRDYVLVMGDADRDEITTLKALTDLNRPIIRVTREHLVALAALRAFRESGVTQGHVLLKISYELLRELYRGARVVVVPSKSDIHPAGMTSLTEAMSCGRPVIIRSGLATCGYVQDGYDAFVLSEWDASEIRGRILKVYETDIGESIGRNARNTVEKTLNFDLSAKKMSNFLTSVGVIENASRIN